RARRTPSADQRRAVQGRDRMCLYPGCAVPATRTHSHHLDHWIAAGPTELWNLGSCCTYHHNRCHDGEFDIIRTVEGDLHFVTPEGRLIGEVTGGQWKRPSKRAG